MSNDNNDVSDQEYLDLVDEAEERLRWRTPEIPENMGLEQILKNPEWEKRYDEILQEVRQDYGSEP